MPQDDATDPRNPNHLPVAGEFDTENPLPDDSRPLNTGSYGDEEYADTEDV